MLQTKNLTKQYGKGESTFQALRGINLDIKRGETVAIVGKSGSGKSTLMHLLAGLDKPSGGEILLEDKNISSLSKKDLAKIRNKKFGFIFQQFFLNPKDDCLENVVMPLKIRGLSKSEREEKGASVLTEVGLEEKMHSRAINLSGGQKQRVCVARALAGEPEVVFADEPTGNLDSETGKTVMDLIFGLNKAKGITLILVTHDEDLARLCQRQVYIKDGLITN
jgi:putative ABC transport system ATP-binding protein